MRSTAALLVMGAVCSAVLAGCSSSHHAAPSPQLRVCVARWNKLHPLGHTPVSSVLAEESPHGAISITYGRHNCIVGAAVHGVRTSFWVLYRNRYRSLTPGGSQNANRITAGNLIIAGNPPRAGGRL